MREAYKKSFLLEGLNCASCAEKIEKKAGQLDAVENATLNFASKTLTLTFNDSKDAADGVENLVQRLVDSIESGVEVLDKDTQNTSSSNKGKWWQSDQFRRLLLSLLLFIIGFATRTSFWISLSFFSASYLLSGGRILLNALENFRRKEIFDENFLMSITTLGAFAIGEFPEGVAVMLFFQVGEFFQGLAVTHSRESITSLMNIKAQFANLQLENSIEQVPPEKLEPGNLIVIKSGEKIPVDALVLEGNSLVDTSALTGEPVPRQVKKGDHVLSGFINTGDLLTARVEKKYSESTVSRILELVEEASNKKAPTETFIRKFARVYTPIVVAMALLLALLPPLFLPGATFSQWIYRSLVFLIISCPCALVVSIPLSFFAGIGRASKSGVLVKGGNYLEALNHLDIIIFDKTGTLTKGVFAVNSIESTAGFTKEDVLKYAASLEAYSNHPIAKSILKKYGTKDNYEVNNLEEIAGLGLKAEAEGKGVLVGNKMLMEKYNIEGYEDDLNPNTTGTIIHVSISGQYAGYLHVADAIKSDAIKAIRDLKKAGIRKVVMLTGDRKTEAENVAKQLGLDEVHAELLPHEKVALAEKLTQEANQGKKVAYVGDGINDAPVLARVDVGIAMGGLGSDAAIEAADVVLMTDEPASLVEAIKISKLTRRVAWQNIVLSLGVKAVFMILGAVGIATLWEAVFADVGITILAVLNSIRIIGAKS